MNQPSDALTTVHKWQLAANTQDLEPLLALSHPEIVIIGPRGQGTGHPLLREWLARANLVLETRRTFAKGDTVVLEQHGVWHDSPNGNVVGEADTASVYRVEEGMVVSYGRYETLEIALQTGGLTAADEVALAT